jgi:Ni,Fe-hydrogenase III small subunit/Pyruvate/2-oxoacid:ferredoxin oxidoreductase delta subunit
MLRVGNARLKQGLRTIRFPAAAPTLPEKFRGLPVLDSTRCPEGCQKCVESCPTSAIETVGVGADKTLRLDLGKCLFCTDCQEACPGDAIHFTQDYRLATRSREELRLDEGETMKLAAVLDERLHRLFGRSLKLRQVSAGGCNACEADLNVLNTIVFDLSRFGIQFVASPRHADGIVVTGAVSRNMQSALAETYAAVPAPKIVIAVGACAISGGPFAGNPEIQNGCGATVPVDLYIPGCPPHPITILDGLLRLLGRIESGER